MELVFRAAVPPGSPNTTDASPKASDTMPKPADLHAQRIASNAAVAHLVVDQRAGQSLLVIVPKVPRKVKALREHYLQERDTCGKKDGRRNGITRRCW